jgi:hypothetical protein
MPWPLTVALVLALVLVGTILLFLAMPVHLTVNVIGGEKRRVHLRIHAFLGLVDKELTAGAPQKKPKQKPGARSGGVTSARRLWAFVDSRGFMGRLGRYLKRLWRALHVGELVGFARIGLDDPADTGQLWAIMGPVSVLLAQRYPDFKLAPSFAGARLDVEGRWRIAIVPLEVLAVTLAFALSPSTLRAAVAAWRTR